MKSKLATWSLIMPVIGFALGFIRTYFVSGTLFYDLSLLGDIIQWIIFLVSTGLGLILGIVALRAISKNPQVAGKKIAVVGIVLNSILFIPVLLLFILLILIELGAPTYGQ